MGDCVYQSVLYLYVTNHNCLSLIELQSSVYMYFLASPGQQAALAQNNRALALDKGEKIYYQMRRDKFMKDHKSRLRTYPNTFSGQEFVGWLVEKEEAADNGEAVLLGQAFLENGVIHHSEL